VAHRYLLYLPTLCNRVVKIQCFTPGPAFEVYREGIRELDLVSEEEREKVYGMEIAEIKDSPGLIVDISFIAAFHTRFVLDCIARALQEKPKYFTPINENYLIWGNRPVHPFNKHFQLQRIQLDSQEQCAVCSGKVAADV
jgi:hypothetical protein